MGDQTLAANSSGRYTSTFDKLGRKTVAANPHSKTVAYTLDAVGDRSSMVDPDGGRFTYTHNEDSQLTALINPFGQRTSFTLDAVGQTTLKQLANGSRASTTHDAAGQVAALSNLKSDSSVISSFEYKHDKAGNRSSVTEADGSRVTWSYDAASQLTREHRTGTAARDTTLTYDAGANMTAKEVDGVATTLAYDNANQLTTVTDTGGPSTYTFDANGNQEIVAEPNGDRTTNTWDYENRLTAIRLPTGSRTTSVYKPDGLRVEVAANTTQRFVWDELNYLLETDDANSTTALWTVTPLGYGSVLSQRRSGADAYVHFDALANTRQLTLASEAVSDTRIDSAFGETIDSSGSTVIPFWFGGELGYYTNTETGDLYVRARTYMPTMARWLSQDPLMDVGFGYFLLQQPSEHPYVYAGNNPINLIDPSGLECTPWKWDFAGNFPRKYDEIVRVRGKVYTMEKGSFYSPWIAKRKCRVTIVLYDASTIHCAVDWALEFSYWRTETWRLALACPYDPSHHDLQPKSCLPPGGYTPNKGDWDDFKRHN